MPKPSRDPAARTEPARDTRSGVRQGDANPPAPLTLRRLFKAVFVDQLRLRRKGPHLTLALESPAPTAPAELPPVVDSPAAQMRRALGELLDSCSGSRTVLKHLAALEHHLEHREDRFIHELSLSSLQHMLRQLQGLIAPPPSPGIALLLAELLDAAELKLRLEQQAEARSQPISSFFVDHKLEVKELSPSTLDLPGEIGAGVQGK
jgi:hypothetical protein